MWLYCGAVILGKIPALPPMGRVAKGNRKMSPEGVHKEPRKMQDPRDRHENKQGKGQLLNSCGVGLHCK